MQLNEIFWTPSAHDKTNILTSSKSHILRLCFDDLIMTRPILKKDTNLTPNNKSSSTRSQEDRIRDTALYHANLLQERKDAEILILASIETLLTYPRIPCSDPAHPSPPDAEHARKLLKSFQLADYDSLIEERNINRKCGYVLCPRPHRRENTNAKYRILRDNTHLRFVERQVLERWCSDDCGRRALYVRVQLNDEPVWTRTTGTDSEVCFLDEGNDNSELVEGFTKLRVDAETVDGAFLADMNNLSIERGSANIQSRSTDSANMEIREKMISEFPPERKPDLSMSYVLPNSIEGYTPKRGNRDTMQENTKK